MKNKKIKSFGSALVVTHIVNRKSPPFDVLEGPYSSVGKAILPKIKNSYTLQIPINGYETSIVFGLLDKPKQYKFPSFFGKINALKYLFDFAVVSIFLIIYLLKNVNKNNLVIGIDPLSCLPLALLRPLLKYKLIFYSVDFNKNRFKNRFMQFLYEKADELSGKLSDQTWVVCQSLKDYKKDKFCVDSIYIPNSAVFNEEFYEKGRKQKKGNKMAWTGSFLTDRQYEILFGILKEIQEKNRSDMKFYFAPMQNHEKFREYGKKFGLKKFEVLELHSRAEWQEFAATCDVGIAIYDPDFGSTEFIEPLKIWDFMLCGMPFIISCEPSISTPIKESGVAYFLAPHNKIPNDGSLKKFLKKENIIKLQSKCIELAKEFDIKKQIEIALKKITA